MIYSQIYFKNQRKIPTLIAGLLILFIGFFLLRLFTRTPSFSRAEKKLLKRLEITNLTSNQAVIYWQTDKKTVGWVIYGTKENELKNIAYDERDLTSKKNQYFHHYVQLKNLAENQVYFFKLISDNQFLNDANDKPFSFKTEKNSVIAKKNTPAYGKVIQKNGAPLENAIVLLRINSQVFSTLTKATGEWLILLQFSEMTNKDKVEIEILSEDGLTSIVNTDLSKVTPLPQTVIIGNNLDLTKEKDVLSESVSQAAQSSVKEIDIIYPQENKIIPASHPLIKGRALPNEEVIIEIYSKNFFSSKVKADVKGGWILNLPFDLTPGDQKIVVKTKDKTGNLITLERKFIIAKSGEQVLGSATPSAKVTTYPTATPTFLPTPTAISTPIPVYSPISQPPVSGSNVLIFLTGAFSLIILGLGLIIVF